MSSAEFDSYDVRQPDSVKVYQDFIQSSDWLIFFYPTWWYTVPANLKGFFDRVWTPDFAFGLTDGRSTPLLTNIRRLSVVTTYGAEKNFIVEEIGEPGRLFFEKGVMRLLCAGAKFDWLSLYGMDQGTEASAESFIDSVTTKLLEND